MTGSSLLLKPLFAEVALKDKVYDALREAIVDMDVYSGTEPPKLDERKLAEQLGVSRTPVREALSRLEQEGLVKTFPRRGAYAARKTKTEILEIIGVWAALESMAARMATEVASDVEIKLLREYFSTYDEDKARARIDEYSGRNISFHQSIIKLSHCDLLIQMAEGLFVHMRRIRAHTIGEEDRAGRSIIDHMHIIEALEARDTELAEKLVREHTIDLANHVAEHVNYLD